MKIEDFLFKIRRRESSFYSKLKDILLGLIHFNLPAPKFIFRPMYELLVFWRFLSQYIVEKLFYVPVFRSRCEHCGKGLTLSNGVPWIEGNLIIRIGENVMLDGNVFSSGRMHKDPVLTIGNRVVLGYKTHISVSKSVKIGNDCLIAAGCMILDNDGHPIDPNRRLCKEPVRDNEIKPVVIEDNVWIGTGCIILKGVTIGTGSIISANSLVTRSIPPYSIAMGVPAKVVISGIDKVYGNKA
jgi:acetyltransferase-like isoleucine patch superfamily enzyme